MHIAHDHWALINRVISKPLSAMKLYWIEQYLNLKQWRVFRFCMPFNDYSLFIYFICLAIIAHNMFGYISFLRLYRAWANNKHTYTYITQDCAFENTPFNLILCANSMQCTWVTIKNVENYPNWIGRFGRTKDFHMVSKWFSSSNRTSSSHLLNATLLDQPYRVKTVETAPRIGIFAVRHYWGAACNAWCILNIQEYSHTNTQNFILIWFLSKYFEHFCIFIRTKMVLIHSRNCTFNMHR